MHSARVSKLLFLFIAVLTAATLSTGSAWATPGTCESLPGGVIELESTGGAVGPTGYATLGAALADVNNGSYTGTITIDVCGDTTEGASAVLNASGTGGSSYTGVTISPAGGASRTISGGIAGALIDLNGAGSVVIDGLNTGSNALTVDNTSTAAAAATIRFIADASGNTVRNCTIKGSTTGATSGTIVFSTGSLTGNVNDSITANTITASGLNLPVNAIYSAGTSTPIANSGIAITNNNIQDYFSGTLASNGIFVASNSAAWTITGNKFFQTAPRTATTAVTHRAINVVTASGGGYTVSNNTVGYDSAGATGTTSYTSTVATFYRAIELTVAASPVSEIQGNTVTAISFATASSSAVAPGVFAGISVLGGSVNVGTTSGNTVGSTTAPGAISITSTLTGSLSDGIYVAAANATASVQNNNVGGITASSATPAVGFVVRGIETAGTLGTVTLSGNMVGSATVANSIQVGINPTTTAVTSFAGIQQGATGTIAITNNTVQNNSVLGSGASIFQGIVNTGGTGILNITGNSVIAGTSRGTGQSQGIVTSSPAATANVTNNTVRNMTLMAASGAFRGIEQGGAVTVAINLTDNKLGLGSDPFVSYTGTTSGVLNGVLNGAGGANSVVSILRNDVRGIIYLGAAGTNEIDCINTAASSQRSMTISDNTITNLNVNTSGTVFLVRNQATQSAAGIQAITNNAIVGTFSRATAGTTHGFMQNNNGGGAGSASISNNNFSNITVPGTSSAFCINSQDSAPRTIEGNVCNNWSGGSGGSLTGIRVAGFTGGNSATVRLNTITNFTSAGTLTGIQAEGTSPATIIRENTINTLSTSNGGITGIVALTPSLSPTVSTVTVILNTISSLSTSGGGSPVGMSLGSTVGTAGFFDVSASENVISGFSSSFAGAAPIGIGVNNQTRTAKIFRNKIYDIQITGTTGTVTGLSGGGVTNDFYNNLVGDLRAPSATTAGNPNVIGLAAAAQVGGTNVVNFYNNTVYIAGTSSGSPFATAGVFTPSGPTLKIRNNVVVNASIPTGSGRAVAVWRNYQPLWNYDSSSNNNDLYASTAYYDGVTAYPTMSDMWAAVYPRESASFSENPTFLSTTGTSANFLHIVPAMATLLESRGVNVSIPPALTDDYDTDIRQGNPGYAGGGTAPDVGADEFEGMAVGDVQPPAIVYSPLGAGAPGPSRSLTANIVDAMTGVATSPGVRPRLYFKKSTDANDQTGWKYVEAIGSGDTPFDFTMYYSMLNAGSVSVGDVIQYFVVAQDTVATPNIGIYQGAFAAPPTSVALTPAAFPIGATINSYTIGTPVSGTLTVCPSGCDFLSLTNAGGLFEALNGRVFTGNVTVDILGDSMAETGLNALNQWPEDPTTNATTLTIRPGGFAARTVSGNVAGSMIKLNGADRVTIDGLNTDGNSLTVSNTSVTSLSTTIQLFNAGVLEAGASNNTIRNLSIVGGSICTPATPPTNPPVCPTGIYGIEISGATVNTAGADNDGNTISGNTITKVSYGIHNFGGTFPASAANDNLVISNNIIGPASMGADSLGASAILVNNAINLTVSGNTIRNISVSTATERAINLNTGVAGGSIANNTITNVASNANLSGPTSIGGIYLGNLVSNMTVSRNKIQSVWNTVGTGAGARGIVANSNEVGIVIANNMISDIFCVAGTNNSGTNWPVGIHVETAASLVRVYNNSVNLFGQHTGLAGTTGSAAMLVGGGVANLTLDLRDNVFANSYDNSTSTTERSFSINAANVLNTAFLDINFNDYYVNGALPANNFIGNLGGTNVTTLAAWKTQTGKDASSIAADPLFVGPTDLHINTSGGASPIENTGSPLVSVTNDIDGDLRHPTNPDIGADEVRCHAAVPAEVCNDANPCTVDSCAPATGCSNLAGNAGDVCRAVTGACDAAETCDGTSSACPADTFVPVGVVCRTAAGDCDATEVCTGAGPACPADVVQPSSYVCRVAAGGCDIADSCDGTSTNCPADIVQPAATLCRASAGDCDVAESCDGASALCPNDSVQPAATVCRASAGDCDVTETCDGAGTACPTDAVQSASTVCRASAGDCDVAESCDGATTACPTDSVQPVTTVCRASAGACDVAESCNGSSVACPNDAVAPAATVCRAAAGGCDDAEACDGSTTACPADVIKAAGVECRAVAGNCDFAEACDGATTACPADIVETAGVECRASAGICDVAEACDGTNGACPANAFEPDTTVCRESAATCDPAEMCTGKDSACPANAVNASAPVGNSVRLSHNKATSVSTITWNESEPGPFNVSRGAHLDSAPWVYNHGCYAQGLMAQSTTNTMTPSVGQMLYFLVSRDDTHCPESSLGPDSAGTDRPNPAACPNPGADVDFDGTIDALDNCPMVYNPSQNDVDMDAVGDVCDNCAITPNQSQSDVDNDGIGDACDTDMDADGMINAVDNCPRKANPDQLDADGNGIGDACE